MTAWTEAELATLGAVAETFVRGAAQRRAALAAEALDLALDPGQVGQLRLALRLMESRAANLALTGRLVRFAELRPGARERYLLGWGTSRLPLRRSAFQAFRKLLSFLAYADPGESGAGNPYLAAIGYVPDDPGLTLDPTPIRPLELLATGGHDPDGVDPDGLDPDRPIVLEADVAIVGSGAGGSVVARALAEAGRSVVVVEAGPFVPEPEMPRNELDAFDRLYLAHGLAATWDGSITTLSGAGVGGGTTVNWMTCIGAPDAVRSAWARTHGIDGFDGPEGDADFAAIAAELGVAEVNHVPPKDAVILRGAAALGLEAAPTRRNAIDCGECGSCPFGCRAGAKRSVLRAHLADAHRAGARIVPDARVERVIVESGRAAGLEATVGWERPSARAVASGVRPVPRHRLVVRARQVVVAAGALRTPVVLERSGLEHPALGRFLRVHPVPLVAGRYADPVEMWRGTMQAARSVAFIDDEPGRNGYVIESAPGHPGLGAQAFPWEGTDRHAELMTRFRWLGALIAITRDGGEGRVRATRAGGTRIDYRVDQIGVTTMRHALVSMARIARAAGAREIVAVGTPPLWHGSDGFAPGGEERAFAAFEERLRRFDFGPNRGAVFSAHQMGTARLGADSRDHVCDPGGRVRATVAGRSAARRPGAGLIPGLYVADGSLFPTGLGVNPMLTVMALARRVARTIMAEA